MARLLLLVALVATLPAQTVQLVNNGVDEWYGWHRVYLHQPPPSRSGWTTPFDVLWVAGTQNEDDLWPIDVRTPLLPGQQRTFALSACAPVVSPVLRLQNDPTVAWGGAPTINGVHMQLAPFEADGAGLVLRWSTTVNFVWHLTVEFTYYPDLPSHVPATVRAVAADWSNPAVIYSTSQPLMLVWGSSMVLTHGQPPGVVVPAGTQLTHGDRLTTTHTVVWPSLMRDLTREWAWAHTRHARSLWASD